MWRALIRRQSNERAPAKQRNISSLLYTPVAYKQKQNPHCYVNDRTLYSHRPSPLRISSILSLITSLSLSTWTEPPRVGGGTYTFTITQMAAMRSDTSAVEDGQCSRTGSEVSGDGGGGRGFMLFGVRVLTEGSFRKSVSMNNLAQYDQLPQDSSHDVAAGYASDDVVHPSGRSRERKRGVPWSEEEHRLFLLGLQKVGKGDWRGISRNYVKTRTPTQVASHAQKYFLRRNNHNRRRRRSSLFDITTDAVVGSAIDDDQMYQENSPQPPPPTQQTKNLEKFPLPNFGMAITPVVVPITTETPMDNLSLGQVNQLTNSPKPIRPIPILPVPPSSKMAGLNINKTTAAAANQPPPSLSLNLSMSSQPPPASQEQPPPARHASAFQAMPAAGFNGSGGDSMISVA